MPLKKGTKLKKSTPEVAKTRKMSDGGAARVVRKKDGNRKVSIY